MFRVASTSLAVGGGYTRGGGPDPGGTASATTRVIFATSGLLNIATCRRTAAFTNADRASSPRARSICASNSSLTLSSNLLSSMYGPYTHHRTYGPYKTTFPTK